MGLLDFVLKQVDVPVVRDEVQTFSEAIILAHVHIFSKKRSIFPTVAQRVFATSYFALDRYIEAGRFNHEEVMYFALFTGGAARHANVRSERGMLTFLLPYVLFSMDLALRRNNVSLISAHRNPHIFRRCMNQVNAFSDTIENMCMAVLECWEDGTRDLLTAFRPSQFWQTVEERVGRIDPNWFSRQEWIEHREQEAFLGITPLQEKTVQSPLG